MGQVRETRAKRPGTANAAADSRTALRLLAAAMQQHRRGRTREALELCRQAGEIAPRLPDVHFVTGLIQQERKEFAGAISAYRRAIEHSPGYFDALVNLGVCYRADGRLDEAIDCYRKALEIRPDSAVARKNLGMAHLDRNDLEAAAVELKRAAELEPDNIQIEIALCRSLRQLGRFEEPERRLNGILEREPDNSTAIFQLTYFRNPAGRSAEELLSHTESLLENRQLKPADRANLAYAAGRLHERAGNADEAFAHYKEANDIRASGYALNRASYAQWFADVREVFTRELIAEKARLGHPSDRPIFVLGMPRSGTTLVEQILAAHPLVYGAGELNALTRVVHMMRDDSEDALLYPHCMKDIGRARIRELAEAYLAEIAGRAEQADEGDARHITDKLPINFLRVGLISILFPNAAIIHCRRHPLDTCLSNYFQSFKPSVDALAYSYTLDDMAFYYRQYNEIMEHWRHVLPKSFFEAEYERLVADPEPVVRAMIAHCGLDWNDACLEFHRQARTIQTASLWQARQPIYASSAGKWRQYEKHLRPLRDALADLLPEEDLDEAEA